LESQFVVIGRSQFIVNYLFYLHVLLLFDESVFLRVKVVSLSSVIL